MMFAVLTWLAIGLAIRTSVLRDARRAWRSWATATLVCSLAACAVALAGCPLPQPDGCAPMATRCSPQGKPQRCSASQRWWSEPTARACAELSATCCLARSPFGNNVHACVPASACIAEPTLTDALVESAVDAVLEGGAQ